MEEIGKPIEWSTRAAQDLKKIESFYTDLYGNKKAVKIIDILILRIKVLRNANFEKIGSIDESFAHLKGEYRKLIENYIKVTYRIDKTKIYIVRVFDMRQDPRKNL